MVRDSRSATTAVVTRRRPGSPRLTQSPFVARGQGRLLPAGLLGELEEANAVYIIFFLLFLSLIF